MDDSVLLDDGRDEQQQQQQQCSVQFCKFVAACLHGESDPRCLLQLLQLFDTVFDKFAFLKSSSNNLFPVTDFFDATAPYYPVQFTPPPNNNNIYGITKAGLRHAVLQVLSNTSMDTADDTDDDDNNNNNMASLSINLLLEALVPPPEDGPATFTEQLEALEDMQTFLFTTCCYNNNNGIANLDKLKVLEIQHVAQALWTVHETASLAVVVATTSRRDGGGVATNNNKITPPRSWPNCVAALWHALRLPRNNATATATA